MFTFEPYVVTVVVMNGLESIFTITAEDETNAIIKTQEHYMEQGIFDLEEKDLDDWLDTYEIRAFRLDDLPEVNPLKSND